MKYFITLTLIVSLISINHAFTEEQKIKTIRLMSKQVDDVFAYPTLELKGLVAEIFSFDQAEWISGLTCRIKYNGNKPLPSKVFFSEYDENGDQISKKTRLIYPKLNSGESGHATFRIKSHTSKIIIWSEGGRP